jgi:adenylate cyclase
MSDRSTLVALNADVVAYSRLLADDAEGTMATMREYRGLVADHVEAHRGTLPQFVGDNFMALFADAKDAVQAAIAITRAIEEHNADIPENRRVRFRMGMDVGEVVVVDGNRHGDALNIAARIQAIARPGGLSVSGGVYRALDEPALRFTPLGPPRMKNIPEAIEVFEFAALPSEGLAAAERSSLSLESPTVAVIPIHADDEMRVPADILRHELVHRLARVPELRVLDAGSETGGDHQGVRARYMLETGVAVFGEDVRVYATLFDVTTMNVVKSHKWMTTASEVVGLSEEIADEVARSLEVELVVGEPAGLYADLGDPEAIENVYLGWYHLRSDTREGWTKALELFERVAVSHPEQPFGHVLTAFALFTGASAGFGADPAATLQEARRHAQAGIEIGDPTGMARAVDAAVLMAMGQVDDAMEAMEQIQIMRPTCDVTYGLEGSLRRYLGEWEKAVDLLDVAMRLTGINKPWYPTVKACSLFVGGRLEQAASIAQSVLDFQPNNLEALLVLAAAQAELGLERRAQATAATIRERFPTVDPAAWLDASPFVDAAVVDRWKADLVRAGAIPA